MRYVFGFAAVLLLSLSALAQGLEVFPGQTITATIEGKGETGIIRMTLLAGETFSFKLSVAKGSGLHPEIAIFDPAGGYFLLPVHVGPKLSGTVPVTRTGVWYFTIWGQGGTTGEFTLATKLKAAKPPARTFNAGIETITADLRKGAVLKCSAKAATAGFALGIDSVDSPGGQNVVDPATVSESGGSVSFSTVAVPYSGTYAFRFAARSGGTSQATAKLSAKVPKVAVAKPLPNELYETMVVKDASDPTKVFAEVDGFPGLSAVLIRNDSGVETPLVPDGDSLQCEVTGPDDWYVLRVTLPGNRVADHCFHITGDFPPAPVITDVDDDGVSWTAGSGAQVFHIGVWCETGADDDLYSFLSESVQRSANLPHGLIAPGWPFAIELAALSQGCKVNASTWTSPAQNTMWKGAAAIGDLVALTIDTSSGSFTYTPVEPAGGTDGGTLDDAGDLGPFAFRIQGSSPPLYVFAQPGLMVAGMRPNGAFAVVPSSGANVTGAQIAQSYNLITLRGSGPDPKTEYGHLAVYEAGSYAIWLGADRQLLASGDWDQSGGVVRLWSGANKLANVVFGGNGNHKLATLDFTGDVGDPGIGIAIEQVQLEGSFYAGSYTGIATDVTDPDTITFAGSTLSFPEDGPIGLKLDTPYHGMASGGSDTSGGVLMTAPGCSLVIGSWGDGDMMGIYFRR